MRYLTELQRALVHRAVNTEINLLNRLYGVSDGTAFTFGNATFQEQVDELKKVEEYLDEEEDLIRQGQAEASGHGHPEWSHVTAHGPCKETSRFD